MPNNFQIKISDFTGIFRAIAEKSNIDGNDTLENEEISIFYITKKTVNKEQSIFFFDNKMYDAKGKEFSGEPYIAINDKIKTSNHNVINIDNKSIIYN